MGNKMKEKIANGDKVVGTFLSSGNTSMMECLGHTNMDYVLIDAEHGPFDTETIMDLVSIAKKVDLTPFVRIADVSHREIQRVIDLGAEALIVPCLRTMEEIKNVVHYGKFAPIGNRGFVKGRGCGFGFEEWAAGSVADYMAACNDRLMIIPQCETAELLDIIEDVVKVEGIDGIFVGPYDLSISIGHPGEFDHPDFIAAVNRILKACKDAGKASFIYTGDVQTAKDYLNAGFDGVTHRLDFDVLIESYREIVKRIKE